MTINWFEGGRRVVAAIGTLIALGALLYLFAGDSDDIILESSSPHQRFHWTLNTCNHPDLEKVWNYATEFEPGKPRRVVMCFKAKSNGNIDYVKDPVTETTLPTRPETSPVPSTMLPPTFAASSSSPEVERYALMRMKSFEFTRREFEAIAAEQWKIRILQLCERAMETLQWVVGLILGLWIVATGMGWLTRGFAGIPNDRDFKVGKLDDAARKSCASDAWLRNVVVGWCVLGGIAWLIHAVLTPGPTALWKTASALFVIVGVFIIGGIVFAIFFGGGFALRNLTARLFLREDSDLATGNTSIFIFGLANCLFVSLISLPLSLSTFVDTWMDGLDRWSRVDGLAEGCAVVLFALSLLWPFIPLTLLSRLDAAKETNNDDE